MATYSDTMFLIPNAIRCYRRVVTRHLSGLTDSIEGVGIKVMYLTCSETSCVVPA